MYDYFRPRSRSTPHLDYRRCSLFFSHCFARDKIRFSLTGFTLPSATGEQGEGYDRRVIDFFDRTLR